MAKFKVGDKVDIVGTRMRNKIISKVVFDHGISSDYELKGVPGVRYQESMLTPALNPRNSSTSTNPVVQNALAACNGINDWWGFRKGDKVRAKYWKNPNAVGIVTGLASMGGASDGSDTFLFVDFPTEKNVSCSIKELVKNSAVAANTDYDPKFYIDAFLDSDGLLYAKDGVGEIAAENPNAYEGYAKVDPRGKKIAELIRAAKQFNNILRKF